MSQYPKKQRKPKAPRKPKAVRMPNGKMKPIDRRFRLCPETQKNIYSTEEAAEFFLSVFGGLRTYVCPFCGFWHLTAQPPRTAEPSS